MAEALKRIAIHNLLIKGGTMYTLIRAIQIPQLLFEQAPLIGVSLVIAELFYKFHSFTLECIAFLATWYLLDLTVQLVRKLLRPGNNANP
jgi:hypothetical protein